MTFHLYYASAIDVCVTEAFERIAKFKKMFAKYKIEVFGAGFGDSPIIPPNYTEEYKGVITAYDFRKIRECDILLVVTDLETFCGGTMMELEYARQLGLYTILLCPVALKNIFLESLCNKIIHTKRELEEILKDITREEKI
jgi:nucleoside 2-deoxyribosyltransferase